MCARVTNAAAAPAVNNLVRIVCGDQSTPSMRFRVSDHATFAELQKEACTFWGVPSSFDLWDPVEKLLWPPHAVGGGRGACVGVCV